MQRKVQKLDEIMNRYAALLPSDDEKTNAMEGRIRKLKPENELNKLAQWHRLKSLRQSLTTLLPTGGKVTDADPIEVKVVEGGGEGPDDGEER